MPTILNQTSAFDLYRDRSGFDPDTLYQGYTNKVTADIHDIFILEEKQHGKTTTTINGFVRNLISNHIVGYSNYDIQTVINWVANVLRYKFNSPNESHKTNANNVMALIRNVQEDMIGHCTDLYTDHIKDNINDVNWKEIVVRTMCRLPENFHFEMCVANLICGLQPIKHKSDWFRTAVYKATPNSGYMYSIRIDTPELFQVVKYTPKNVHDHRRDIPLDDLYTNIQGVYRWCFDMENMYRYFDKDKGTNKEPVIRINGYKWDGITNKVLPLHVPITIEISGV